MSAGGYEIICGKCRTAVSSEAERCPNCGEPLRVTEQWPPRPPADVVEPRPAPPQPPAVGPAYGLAGSEAGGVAYGGFWIRVLAYLIDSILLSIAGGVLRLVLGFVLGTLIAFVGVWLYYALMESSASQATIGKTACGLRVTDEQGRRISFGRATGRYFAKILSALIFLIGFMMVGWTRRKQGLHDFIAGTLVVKAR